MTLQHASSGGGFVHGLQSSHTTYAGNTVSLRNRQKLARREKMIEAARTLFVANGYDKTTMEAIADAASVGVATVYTYFENKEGVAAAIIRKDNAKVFDEANSLFDSLPTNPVEAVASLTSIFKDFNRFISAELLRDFIIQAKGVGPIAEALAWCHQCQINLIDRVLTRGQTIGSVSPALDTILAAQLIADLLDRHVSRLTKSQDVDAVTDQLTDFISLLFQNWSGSGSIADGAAQCGHRDIS